MDIVDTDLLIIGGDNDSCITRLLSVCREYDVDHKSFLVGPSGTPSLILDIQTNQMTVNGRIYHPKSVFLRPNVFNYVHTGNEQERLQSKTWFECFLGWAAGSENIKLFNKQHFNRSQINKAQSLILAQKYGLNIAQTYYSNTIELINTLAQNQQWVEKPVDGGIMTRELHPRDTTYNPYGIIASPITIQKKLINPEIRIFRIGEAFFAFKISAQKLDSREDKNTMTLDMVEVPQKEKEGLKKLTDHLHLDYAAADFKTDAQTGELCFLEVNAGAMFVSFDYVAKGALCMQMIKTLTGKQYNYKA